MNRNVFVGAMTLLVVSLLPAKAQVRLDMTRVTCQQWLAYDRDTQNLIRFWMSGYYSASKNTDVLDLRYLQRNTEKVAAYCKTHGAEGLMSAIQRNAI